MNYEHGPGTPPEEYNPDALYVPPFEQASRHLPLHVQEDLGIVTPQAREDMANYNIWKRNMDAGAEIDSDTMLDYYKTLMTEEEAEMAMKLEDLNYWRGVKAGNKVSITGVQRLYKDVNSKANKYDQIYEQELASEDTEAADKARKVRNIFDAIRVKVYDDAYLKSLIDNQA